MRSAIIYNRVGIMTMLVVCSQDPRLLCCNTGLWWVVMQCQWCSAGHGCASVERDLVESGSGSG